MKKVYNSKYKSPFITRLKAILDKIAHFNMHGEGENADTRRQELEVYIDDELFYMDTAVG